MLHQNQSFGDRLEYALHPDLLHAHRPRGTCTAAEIVPRGRKRVGANATLHHSPPSRSTNITCSETIRLLPAGVSPFRTRFGEAPCTRLPRQRRFRPSRGGLAHLLSIAHKGCRPLSHTTLPDRQALHLRAQKMLRISGNRLLVHNGCIRHTPTPGANDHISSRTKDLGTPLRAPVKGGGAILDSFHGHTPGSHRAR